MASRIGVLATMGLLATGATVHATPAHADQVAYLLNVTVRTGYNFANADDALSYGHGICDEIGTRRSYGQIVSDVKTKFATTDGHQVQLRNSAAGYPGLAAVTP